MNSLASEIFSKTWQWFLGAFAKLQGVPIRFVMSVRMEQLSAPTGRIFMKFVWTDFHEICLDRFSWNLSGQISMKFVWTDFHEICLDRFPWNLSGQIFMRFVWTDFHEICLDRFPWNLSGQIFMKFVWTDFHEIWYLSVFRKKKLSPSFITIWQQQPALYMNTDIHFWSYLAHFFL